MAKARARGAAPSGPGRLLKKLTGEWEQTLARRLPPEFTTHMRAALRELFLAIAALSESALHAAEARTAAARRRVERIPIGLRPGRRPRRTGQRRG
jgi:hypothetical protein